MNDDNPKRFSPMQPDLDGTEIALRFLEADPTYPGSEPLKRQLAHGLRLAPLSPAQRNRVAALLLRALRHGTDELFESYARLAPAATTPLFEAAVTCYAATCEHPVAARAERVLGVLAERRQRIRTPRPPTNRPPRPAHHMPCAAGAD